MDAQRKSGAGAGVDIARAQSRSRYLRIRRHSSHHQLPRDVYDSGWLARAAGSARGKGSGGRALRAVGRDDGGDRRAAGGIDGRGMGRGDLGVRCGAGACHGRVRGGRQSGPAREDSRFGGISERRSDDPQALAECLRSAVRSVGVRIIEAGTTEELEAALGPRVAMVYISGRPRADAGPLSFDGHRAAGQAEEHPGAGGCRGGDADHSQRAPAARRHDGGLQRRQVHPRAAVRGAAAGPQGSDSRRHGCTARRTMATGAP